MWRHHSPQQLLPDNTKSRNKPRHNYYIIHGRLWMHNNNNTFCQGLCIVTEKEEEGEEGEVEGEAQQQGLHPNLQHQRDLAHDGPGMDATADGSPRMGPSRGPNSAPSSASYRTTPTGSTLSPERRTTFTRASSGTCTLGKNIQ